MKALNLQSFSVWKNVMVRIYTFTHLNTMYKKKRQHSYYDECSCSFYRSSLM